MRCHAKSKRSDKQCKSWAVRGKKVCRMHGAFAGVKTKEGRQRQVKAVTKHGLYSKKFIAENKQINKLVKTCKQTLLNFTSTSY